MKAATSAGDFAADLLDKQQWLGWRFNEWL
jgi:hypothetical protein